jgi:Fe2+ transport system protein FeoA
MSASVLSPSFSPPADLPQPLCELSPRATARVARVCVGPDDAVRLMALGVCVGRRITIVKTGDPLIVQVVGARVGLSERLAAGVLVEPVHAAQSATNAA